MHYFENKIRLKMNNLTVSYTDEGPDDAPVIVFIHGFPMNKFMWEKQVDILKENFHVIAYDVRGNGSTDIGNEDFTIDLFTDDLINLMDTLKLDKVSLCGLSMGGYIVLNAVEKYPDRFEAIVLSDTQCFPDSPLAKEKRKIALENIKEKGVELYAAESVKNLFAPESFTTKIAEIAAVREMIESTSEQSLCNTLLALASRKGTCNKLSGIKIPVLILVGAEDKITPPAAAQLLHGKIKHSLLHNIKHAGHLSNLENPNDFNDQLKRFFASVYNKH